MNIYLNIRLKNYLLTLFKDGIRVCERKSTRLVVYYATGHNSQDSQAKATRQ